MAKFTIYTVTTRNGEWQGVEEVRKEPWGTTHHPVMNGTKPLVLQDTHTIAFHQRMDLKEKIVLAEIRKLVLEAKLCYTK